MKKLIDHLLTKDDDLKTYTRPPFEVGETYTLNEGSAFRIYMWDENYLVLQVEYMGHIARVPIYHQSLEDISYVLNMCNKLRQQISQKIFLNIETVEQFLTDKSKDDEYRHDW